MEKSKLTKSILIKAAGTVQGVGFRPFVFNLALSLGLRGYVRNTGAGVEILLQGAGKKTASFMAKIKNADFKAVYEQKTKYAPKCGGFKILKSKKTEILSEFPYDLALCDKCKKELFAKKDRRFEYPFINCVNCGPRFSIIKKLPYDRKNTTMSKFKMCKKCRSEYNDPSDRRFHAQPNACPECGPSLFLLARGGKLAAAKGKALKKSIELIKAGKILAVKSIGGYHLVCDAANVSAVRLLRKRKKRPFKPFAVMAELNTAEKFCRINKYEKSALQSGRAPIVLLEKSRGKPYLDMSEALAPDSNSLGIMLPYAPLHHLLIKEIPVLVMTSGNRSDEPVSINEREAFENLSGIADYFLVNDRDIENRSDDSIVKFIPGRNEKILIRRSRGYVPEPVKIGTIKNMIASGGDIKNTFCITRNENAYPSQYIGDLENAANAAFFKESIRKMQRFLGVKPEFAVCDNHPGYFSSRHFKKHYKNCQTVLHHYAHTASVIAENAIKGKALGFSFDGTGYGEDARTWGGEVILFDGNQFSRVAHFDYFALPGGDICAKEPWRVAVSILCKYGLPIPEHLKKYEYAAVEKMSEAGINSPLSSSAGRIFDAVAAILNIKCVSTYEAEAASALEAAAVYGENKSYPFSIDNGIIDMKKTFISITGDISNGTGAGIISARFHNTVCAIIIKIMRERGKKSGICNAVLSGGVFQNLFLLEKITRKLKKNGISVFYNKKMPINDGGLCAGQAFINNLLLKNK